jgi:hypothetical protein
VTVRRARATATLAVRMAPGARRIGASRLATPMVKEAGKKRQRPARRTVLRDGESGAVGREALIFFPVLSVTRHRTNRCAPGCGESCAASWSPVSGARLQPRSSRAAHRWAGGTPRSPGGRTGGHGRNHMTRERRNGSCSLQRGIAPWQAGMLPVRNGLPITAFEPLTAC